MDCDTLRYSLKLRARVSAETHTVTSMSSNEKPARVGFRAIGIDSQGFKGALDGFQIGNVLANAVRSNLGGFSGVQANLDNFVRVSVASQPVIPTTSFAQSIGIADGWIHQFNRNWLDSLPKFDFGLPSPLTRFLDSFDWDAVARRGTPTNWSDDAESRLDELIAIANDEGIPITWVPSASLLDALLNAESADARSQILVERRDEIAADCESWIEELDIERLALQVPLAKKALAACRDGHWEVAAITAVLLVHAVVESLGWVSDRQRVAKYHRLTLDIPFSQLLERSTRAPLVLFYDDWNEKSGQPRPAHITRHVVSHSLGADQVSERNCVVAIMLMTSLLVSVDQLALLAEAA